MNRTDTPLAARLWVVAVLGLLLLGGLVLSGCAEPPAIAAVQPTATVYAPLPTEPAAPPPEPTPAAIGFPLAAPSRMPAEEVNDQTCVDCHTDKDRLRAVARQEEVVEELSEGEG